MQKYRTFLVVGAITCARPMGTAARTIHRYCTTARRSLASGTCVYCCHKGRGGITEGESSTDTLLSYATTLVMRTPFWHVPWLLRRGRVEQRSGLLVRQRMRDLWGLLRGLYAGIAPPSYDLLVLVHACDTVTRAMEISQKVIAALTRFCGMSLR